LRRTVEYNCHGAREKDKARSDVVEDMVVDVAKNLFDKGGRGGDNNNDGNGVKGPIWTMSLSWQLYYIYPRKRMGGV
jgi:hypothetical protein